MYLKRGLADEVFLSAVAYWEPAEIFQRYADTTVKQKSARHFCQLPALFR